MSGESGQLVNLGRAICSKWAGRPNELAFSEVLAASARADVRLRFRQKHTMPTKLEPGAFYGTTERRYELRGLTLAETVYPSGLAIPPHEHVNAFFCFFLEGRCTQSWDRRSWNARPETLTSFPAGLAHANRWHDSGGRVLHIEFAAPWLERLRGQTAVLEHPADYEGGPLVWLARRLVEEFRQRDDVSPLAVEGLVLELLAECSRSRVEPSHADPPRWLDRVRELLHDRFSHNLSLDEVAGAVGISADTSPARFGATTAAPWANTSAGSVWNSPAAGSLARSGPWSKSPSMPASPIKATSRRHLSASWV